MIGEPLRVLLVENSPYDKRVHAALTQSITFPIAVIHEDCPNKGIQRLIEEKIDIILLDLSLPDVVGLDAVRKVHASAPNIPLIALVDSDDEIQGLNVVRAGAQDVLVKGKIAPQLLIRSIRFALERHRRQTAIRSTALIDDLTGLYNRKGFWALAQHQLRLARRNKRSLLLMLADLDGLKYINDTFGHLEGNYALVKTAEILKYSLRQVDIVARLHGDQFVALAGDIDIQDATRLAGRVDKALMDHNANIMRPYSLSLSIGSLCIDPETEPNLNEIMAEADRRLSEKKRDKHILINA